MEKAIWFSRHQPTAGQLDGIAALGFELIAIEDGKRLGAMDIQDDGDIKAVVTALLGIVAANNAVAIFGVPSTPILLQIARTANDAIQTGEWGDAISFYAAWNLQRSIEGGKPTFEHKEWFCIGKLSQDSCRWL